VDVEGLAALEVPGAAVIGFPDLGRVGPVLVAHALDVPVATANHGASLAPLRVVAQTFGVAALAAQECRHTAEPLAVEPAANAAPHLAVVVALDLSDRVALAIVRKTRLPAVPRGAPHRTVSAPLHDDGLAIDGR